MNISFYDLSNGIPKLGLRILAATSLASRVHGNDAKSYFSRLCPSRHTFLVSNSMGKGL